MFSLVRKNNFLHDTYTEIREKWNKLFSLPPPKKKKYCEFIYKRLYLNRYWVTLHTSEIYVNISNNSKIYYMPHNAVIRADKTTKNIKIVFDSSRVN